MKQRLLLDLVMLILLLTVLARPLTGSVAHETAGTVLMALFTIHGLLNRSWYYSLLRGRYDLLRSLSTGVNLALVVAVLTTLVTAVPISRFVFAFLDIDNGMWVAQLHIMAALWLFVLASVHLGFHWEMVKRGLPFPVDGPMTTAGRIGRWGLLILVCCLGMRASLNRNIGSKLIMYYSFDFFRADDSVVGYLADYLSMMSLYACMAHHVNKKI